MDCGRVKKKMVSELVGTSTDTVIERSTSFYFETYWESDCRNQNTEQICKIWIFDDCHWKWFKATKAHSLLELLAEMTVIYEEVSFLLKILNMKGQFVQRRCGFCYHLLIYSMQRYWIIKASLFKWQFSKLPSSHHLMIWFNASDFNSGLFSNIFSSNNLFI